jgi:hypothetical protein
MNMGLIACRTYSITITIEGKSASAKHWRITNAARLAAGQLEGVDKKILRYLVDGVKQKSRFAVGWKISRGNDWAECKVT